MVDDLLEEDEIIAAYEEACEEVNLALIYAKDLFIEGGGAKTDEEAAECFAEMVDVIHTAQSYPAWDDYALDEDHVASVMELPVELVRSMMATGAERARRAEHHG